MRETQQERETNDPHSTAYHALEALFLKAQGKEWREVNRYFPATSRVKPIEGGDPAAIAAYAALIHKHVENLNSLVTTHREFLLPFSRKCYSWPVRYAKRKPFGDEPDEIIRVLEVGAETIANDTYARFNPRSKFGAIAFELLARIEQRRNEPLFVSAWRPVPWLTSAKALPPFTTKPSNEDKRKWLTVIEQVLQDDFRDAEICSDYLSLLTKPSYKHRRKSVFFDKVRNEFETIWGSRRQPKS